MNIKGKVENNWKDIPIKVVKPYPEAPKDGKIYGRNKSNWVEVPIYPIQTITSEPNESLLTFNYEGLTISYKMGDEVRYFDGKDYSFYRCYKIENGRADWRAEGGAITEETLMINISSNQTNDIESLKGVKLKVGYGDLKQELTFEGSVLTAKVPAEKQYTIGEFTSVEGYKTPASKEFMSEAGNTRIVDIIYETGIVGVKITSNQVDTLSSCTATVKYDSVTKKLSFTGKETKTIKIPFGSSFTIDFSDIERYAKPAQLSGVANTLSKEVSGEYRSTKLSVTRSSNQTEELGNSTATVAWGTSDTLNFTNAAKVQTIMIPLGVSYTISFSSITGYKAPGNITGTTSQASESKTGTYQSEFLTVNVSGASGYTITVSGQGSQTTSPKVYKIPFGTSYNISASNIKGYNTPATQSFTANQVSRSVTMTYTKIANGVYICDSDGKLTAVGSWNTGNNSKAVGVAVVSDKCSFIIDKTNSNNSIQWGGYGTDVPGLSNIKNNTEARLDYNGSSNTDKIISSLGSNIKIAAGWCESKSITVGGEIRKGYLPALGEWQTAYDNKSQVDSALSKIGGTAIPDNYHWSSTEYSSDGAWGLYWVSGNLVTSGKNFTLYCRPWYVL